MFLNFLLRLIFLIYFFLTDPTLRSGIPKMPKFRVLTLMDCVRVVSTKWFTSSRGHNVDINPSQHRPTPWYKQCSLMMLKNDGSSVTKSNECFVWDFSGNLGCIHHFTHRMELAKSARKNDDDPGSFWRTANLNSHYNVHLLAW